jgi:dCTP deaminase
MTIRSDRWIRRMAQEHGMIEPFEAEQVRDGVISYGVSSFGYDVRVATSTRSSRRVQRGGRSEEVRSALVRGRQGRPLHHPAALLRAGRTLEYFRIPSDVLVVCVGKSTYARCGIIVNVTPLEPEWCGHLTLEISNTTPLPAKIYSNEGLAQLLFFQGDEVPE